MEITRDLVRELFLYEPSTGWLVRRKKTRNSVKVGEIAGGPHYKNGYFRIGISGKRYDTHYLVWIYHLGSPPKYIDHINGAPSDNRIENLRKCAASENGYNRGRQKNNTSGYKGVTWSKSAEKWQAQISANGKRICLGMFGCPAEAHKAYCKAAKQLHGEFFNSGEG